MIDNLGVMSFPESLIGAFESFFHGPPIWNPSKKIPVFLLVTMGGVGFGPPEMSPPFHVPKGRFSSGRWITFWILKSSPIWLCWMPMPPWCIIRSVSGVGGATCCLVEEKIILSFRDLRGRFSEHSAKHMFSNNELFNKKIRLLVYSL